MTANKKGPLAGYRVIDLTNFLFGPYATQIMGDMGADVIKIEAPGGDTTRYVGPTRSPGMAPVHMYVNRSKRSLVLDLQKPSGLAALKRLVADADVLIHNLRPKPAARLGVAYPDIAAVNPRIVYCSTVGFGRQGPYGDRPAYDDLVQAAAGVAALSQQGGSPTPRYATTVLADKTGALTALYAVLMALLNRERTGRGQEVEVPMFETVAAYLFVEHLWGQTFEPPVGPTGYVRALSPYRKPYATKDGFVGVMPYSDRNWADFFALGGRPELASDPRFSSVQARTVNIDALYQEMERIIATKPTAEWVSALETADIPCSPVNSLDDLLDHPQVKAAGLISVIDHPSEGRIRVVNPPVNFYGTPASPPGPTPLLGQHSVEVLRESGFSQNEIDALLLDGVTLDGAPKTQREQ